MSGVSIRPDGERRYRVDGDLVFGTIAEVLRWPESVTNDGAALIVDLGGVEHADSAGLALLLEWTDLATAGNLDLRFANLPKSLARIAALTNLDPLIPTVDDAR